MGRKILCESCGSVLNEDILKAKNSMNTCLVCGASLGGNDSDIEESQTMPEEELIDWYYYRIGRSHYLSDKPLNNKELYHLEYTFQAPQDSDKAKEILRKQYDPKAFIDTSTPLKTDAQWIAEGKCPKCHSSNITIIQRKWSPLTGFRTNKTDRVCVNCKHKW